VKGKLPKAGGKQAPVGARRTRKKRTRQHVLAELSANHVERHALACGYAVERVEHDYGIDLILFTYDRAGNWHSGFVFIQLKATDHLRFRKDGTISFAVSRADLEWWLDATDPVVLVVYDAKADQAYWLYIQAYFEALPGFQLSNIGASTNVSISRANLIDPAAIRRFDRFRADVAKQLQGVVRHHA
jgi:hypothetical protein